MTCIAGMVTKNGVLIGGDSAGVAGDDIDIRADEKVFRRGEFLIGFTSSFRMGQLLRYSLNAPPQHPDMDTFEYMVTVFIEAVRATLEAGGFASKEDGAERGGCFLVGYQGRLFMVDSDYQVAEHRCGYAAIGCGAAYALGAIHAMKSGGEKSERRMVETALEAAAQWSTGVRAPFTILHTGDA